MAEAKPHLEETVKAMDKVYDVREEYQPTA
jgi:hypothetical protein